MDRTAPTILPHNLNHVIGTVAARLSVDTWSADQISADERILSGGRKGCGTAIDGARIPFFKVEITTALTACTAVGTVLRLFRDLPLPLKKPGHNRAMGPTKEKENETY
jgi:hypothetical protein